MPFVNPLTIGRAMSRPSVATALSTSRHFSVTPNAYEGITLLQDKKNGFGFARSNPRPAKPRTKGVTEIRGPYYSVGEHILVLVSHGANLNQVMGKRYLADVLET